MESSNHRASQREVSVTLWESVGEVSQTEIPDRWNFSYAITRVLATFARFSSCHPTTTIPLPHRLAGRTAALTLLIT